MPTFRYWCLDDEEDPENDSTTVAEDSGDAAEMAAELINDGGDPISSNKIELAVRMLGKDGQPDGPMEMFEVFVDWSPNFTAYSRGNRP
jgi:hypothetical protein